LYLRIKLVLAIFFVFHSVEYDLIFKYERMKIQYPDLFLELFIEVVCQCEKQNADVNMMIALSWKESKFKNIIGYTGHDIGYFQINRAHIKSNERFEDYFDMKKNVAKGISIYLSAFAISKGNIKNTLARYNGGNNYDLNKYPQSQWDNYVGAIIYNYHRSREEDSRLVVIR
jgi:hypothetical protein